MPHKRTFSDIPDYLHDSPFLPNLTPEIERSNNTSQPREPFIPNPLQLLKTLVRYRNWIALLALVYILWNIDYATRLHGPLCVDQKPTQPVELLSEGVNWKQYAYMQYVTTPDYLCNSMMFFEALSKTGSQADRVILYPKHYKDDLESREAMMLLSAEKTWNVITIPVQMERKSGEYYKWADSLNKLLVFDKRHWQRILMIDSDATLLKSMDELFYMPSQPAVLPKAYWHWPRKLASHVMLIEPSRDEHERVQKAIDKAPFGVYDMEIMNDLFGRKKDCVVLPHRKYALLSGEFRAKNHDAYLGKGVKWDAKQVWDEAKIVHFSDHPLKKPWEAQWEDVKDYKPDCEDDGNCVARDIWLSLYSNYWKKAKDICWVQYGGLPTQF